MNKKINISVLLMLMSQLALSSAVPVYANTDLKKEEIAIEESLTTEDETKKEETVETTSVTESSTSKTESTIEKEVSETKSVAEETTLQSEEIKPIKKDRFLTVTNENTKIWSEKIGEEQVNVSIELFMKTFISKEEVSKDNKLYFSLYQSNINGKDIFIGYIESSSVRESKGGEGIYQPFNKYVTVTNNNDSTYSNFTWKKLNTTREMSNKTFLAKGKYEHVNGLTYFSLFDDKGTWYGYLESSATKVGGGKEGTYLNYGKYVTINNPNYSTYSNFSWLKKEQTQNLLGDTFQARGKYNHLNGLTYLSLYDDSGKWYGYVNERAVKEGAGRQGAYQSYGKYVTISTKNYSTYSNFSWKKRGNSTNLMGQTYQAKGKYKHINGLVYLSLFDDSGKWYGYINEKATKLGTGRQGAYQSYGKYVTVINKNYTTYSNFSWKKRNATKNMTGKTYQAKGKYKHMNGLTYLSLFDSKGNWYGYVNENAVKTGNGQEGAYQSYNRHIIINSKNYSMWQNFDWKLKHKSPSFYGQGLIARGKYTHFNGSTYYSVYDAFGNWKGYINATGAKLVSHYETRTAYHSQMAIEAWYGCAAVSLYTTLRAKGYAGNVTLVNFINGLPLSSNNPDVGQIGDPWGRIPFKQVISPVGLNKYARKYTQNTEIITGSSIDRVITEINSGNIVLYWGRYLMERPDLTENPQHVMMAKGYKVVNGKEYILTQDPGLYSSTDYRAIRWFEKNDFNRYLTKKHRKMMVIR